MGKHYDQSERARTTNKGPLPRFIGLIPTGKAPTGVLDFSSISELLAAIFLICCAHVRQIRFEARKVTFEKSDDLEEVTGWPDYETTIDGGEIEWDNVKFSESSLRPDEREDLYRFDAHCRQSGLRHRILYRDVLERDGFIQTLMLLRPYGLLRLPERDVERALMILGSLPSTHLEGWQARARESLIPLDLVYHVLFREQRLLTFRPLLSSTLRLIRE